MYIHFSDLYVLLQTSMPWVWDKDRHRKIEEYCCCTQSRLQIGSWSRHELGMLLPSSTTHYLTDWLSRPIGRTRSFTFIRLPDLHVLLQAFMLWVGDKGREREVDRKTEQIERQSRRERKRKRESTMWQHSRWSSWVSHCLSFLIMHHRYPNYLPYLQPSPLSCFLLDTSWAARGAWVLLV